MSSSETYLAFAAVMLVIALLAVAIDWFGKPLRHRKFVPKIYRFPDERMPRRAPQRATPWSDSALVLPVSEGTLEAPAGIAAYAGSMAAPVAQPIDLQAAPVAPPIDPQAPPLFPFPPDTRCQSPDPDLDTQATPGDAPGTTASDMLDEPSARATTDPEPLSESAVAESADPPISAVSPYPDGAGHAPRFAPDPGALVHAATIDTTRDADADPDDGSADADSGEDRPGTSDLDDHGADAAATTPVSAGDDVDDLTADEGQPTTSVFADVADPAAEAERVDTRPTGADGRVIGWRPGDYVFNLTGDGREPSASTVRTRYWKNVGATAGASIFGRANMDRLQRGKAPQRRNPRTGRTESMHLPTLGYHDTDGATPVPAWPTSEIDPFAD